MLLASISAAGDYGSPYSSSKELLLYHYVVLQEPFVPENHRAYLTRVACVAVREELREWKMNISMQGQCNLVALSPSDGKMPHVTTDVRRMSHTCVNMHTEHIEGRRNHRVCSTATQLHQIIAL